MNVHPHGCKRRLAAGSAKVLPAFVLVVLPKCPACLAAYIMVATGIGISLAAATYIESFLAAACVLTLSYFAIKKMRQRRGGGRNYVAAESSSLPHCGLERRVR